ARLEVGRETKNVEQGPGMTMVGVDESEAEFAGLRNFANDIGFAARMDADSRDEIGNELWNLEANRARVVDAAMGVAIDGVDGDGVSFAVLMIDCGGDDGGGKAGE